MSTEESNTPAKKPSKPFWELVKVYGKLTLREPTGVIFGVLLPAFLLFIFSNIPSFNQPLPGSTLTLAQVYIPTLIVTVLIMIGLLNIPIPIARDREIGWLRRVSTTPVSPTKLLAAQLTINIILAAVGFTILGVGSVLILGVKATIDIPGFILSLLLAIAVMFSLGMVIASLAPTQGTAVGMTQGLLYPLLFFAGVYVPVQMLPGYLQTISSFTPVGAAVNALNSSIQGTFPSLTSLLVMAVYTVFFGFISIRYFKWD